MFLNFIGKYNTNSLLLGKNLYCVKVLLIVKAARTKLYSPLAMIANRKALFHQKFLSGFLLILTQTQMLSPKLFPNQTQTLTWTLILTPKKANEKSADEYFSFSFDC